MKRLRKTVSIFLCLMLMLQMQPSLAMKNKSDKSLNERINLQATNLGSITKTEQGHFVKDDYDILYKTAVLDNDIILIETVENGEEYSIKIEGDEMTVNGVLHKTEPIDEMENNNSAFMRSDCWTYYGNTVVDSAQTATVSIIASRIISSIPNGIPFSVALDIATVWLVTYASLNNLYYTKVTCRNYDAGMYPYKDEITLTYYTDRARSEENMVGEPESYTEWALLP